MTHVSPHVRSPASETALHPGTSLGRYLVLYRIGGGGVGEVYAAYDPDLDRKVAIKILRRAGTDLPRAQRLQRREAKAMARLRHPQVVTVYDVGEYSGRTFIAMEFVEGVTLREWLARSVRRTWDEVLEVFLQAGRGLAAVHAAGLVHQDFKPANVMVTAEGHALLTDFGLVALVSGDAETVLASTDFETIAMESGTIDLARLRAEPTWEESVADGGLLGTPAYLAPERVEGGDTDARSDQFSFCVALYQALYGEHPYPALHLESYLKKVRGGEVAPPPVHTRVPGWLRKILLRGLSARLENRYAAMDDLLWALDPRRREARRSFAAGLAAMVVVALGLGWAFSQAEAPSPCVDPAARLEGLWDEGRKEQVRRVFSEADATLGTDAFRGVEHVLDGYAEEWSAQHREACEATHERHEQSERMLDLRMACLDSRLEEIRAVTDVLARADVRVVVSSLDMVERLSGLGACADRAELDTMTPPPADAFVRAELERIRATVEEQHALFNSGQKCDVDAVARGAETVRSLGYAPLESRALYVLGLLQVQQEGDTEAAVDTFQEALLAAIAGGDRIQEALIYAQLTQTFAFYRHKSDEARRWKRFTEAALSSLGPGRDDVRFTLLTALGFAAMNDGLVEEARIRYTDAVAVGEELWGPEDRRLAPAWNDLGLIAVEEERFDLGIEYLERSLALREKAVGPENPTLARVIHNLAHYESVLGHYETALELADRALSIVRKFYGDGHWTTAPPRVLRGEVFNALDRPAEAVASLSAAIPVLEASLGEEHWMLAAAFEALGEAHLLRSDAETALGYFEKSREIRESSLRPEHPDQKSSSLALGRAELDRGRPRAALAHLERSRDLAATDPFFFRGELLLRISLGRALLLLGRPAEARRSFEEALESTAAENHPAPAAEARFGWARALEGEDRERAIELGRQALADLSGELSPRTSRLRREIEDWIGRLVSK